MKLFISFIILLFFSCSENTLSPKKTIEAHIEHLGNYEFEKNYALLPGEWKDRLQNDFYKIQELLTPERIKKVKAICELLSESLRDNQSTLAFFLTQFGFFKDLNRYDILKSYESFADVFHLLSQSELLSEDKKRLDVNTFIKKTINPALVLLADNPAVNRKFQNLSRYTLNEVLSKMPYVKVKDLDKHSLSVYFFNKDRKMELEQVQSVWIPSQSLAYFSLYIQTVDELLENLNQDEIIIDYFLDKVYQILKEFKNNNAMKGQQLKDFSRKREKVRYEMYCIHLSYFISSFKNLIKDKSKCLLIYSDQEKFVSEHLEEIEALVKVSFGPSISELKMVKVTGRTDQDLRDYEFSGHGVDIYKNALEEYKSYNTIIFLSKLPANTLDLMDLPIFSLVEDPNKLNTFIKNPNFNYPTIGLIDINPQALDIDFYRDFISMVSRRKPFGVLPQEIPGNNKIAFDLMYELIIPKNLNKAVK